MRLEHPLHFFLATALVSSSASAAAPEGGPVVKVEVDGSIDRAEQVRERITTDAEKVLRDHDVATTVDPKAPRSLTIEIGGERYDYAIELVVERAGKADEPVRLRCECNYDELFAKVSEGVRESVPALQKADDEPVPPSTTPPATNGQPAAPPVEPDRGPTPLGGMGKGGIAALVVGTAALGTGIALAVIGEPEREGESERSVETTDFGPAGYALIGVGAAAVITGAVLIAVDRKRARKRAVSFSPWAGVGLAGITVFRRF